MARTTSRADGNTFPPMEKEQTCDHCEVAPATRGLIVEMDSFGGEMADLCDSCYQQVKVKKDGGECG